MPTMEVIMSTYKKSRIVRYCWHENCCFLGGIISFSLDAECGGVVNSVDFTVLSMYSNPGKGKSN
jgi:hypothetical protein